MKSTSYYETQIQHLAEMKNNIVRSRAGWFRQLALMASAVLGINAALGKAQWLSIQWTGNALLILCILCALVASYFEVYVLKHSAKLYQGSIQAAMAEDREVSPVFGKKPIVFSASEIVAVMSFVSSLFLLLAK